MRGIWISGGLRGLALLLAIAAGTPACAQSNLFGRETFTAVGDVRLTAVNGERSWIDGGFGKSRFGGGGTDSFRLRPKAVEGAVAWQPQLLWALGATVVGIAQDGQEHAVDLSEAFLTLRPTATGPVRVTARAGLLWPPVSLEHSGVEWAVTETITPSAIGSWIGEEVKVVAGEGSVSVPLGGGRIAATGALFTRNDTAGTLLAFRGWALHDEKAVAFGRQPLPPLNTFWSTHQPPYSHPIIKFDDHVGYYAKLTWSPPVPFRIEAFRYDNRGNPEALNAVLEWGWRTRFNSLGAVWDAGPVVFRAQGMVGRTRMGVKVNGVIGVDMRFRSAFLLATEPLGEGSVSARIEAFGTRNHGSLMVRDDNEDGWAATLAGRRPIGAHVTALAEILHVDSRRDARLRLGTAPRQRQTVAQLALRVRI